MPSDTDASLDLYYWPTPNGWKISIMLEECGLPYNLKLIDIGAGEQFSDDFLKISPNNKIPAIVDRDGPGGRTVSVFESGAILQYLGRKTGKLYPEDPVVRGVVEEWLYWQVGGFGPMLGQTHHFLVYAKESVPYAIDRFTREAARLYGVMDKRLAQSEYLAGDYSVADIACVGWASLYERQKQDITHFPNVKRWLDKLLSRPAVQRGLALARENRKDSAFKDPKAHAILFGSKPAG
ncbi:glutathione S-transferase N-terminal domain-containing protein [Bosea sp. PAMC 26642]|uniref:glutathione S-transferase N-terminal domain-containing protein n=1 Tax=Bosea sp. (strain PAMC 26642) TaxID=1792307 RepID=UPI0007700C08|nr:glutathione S-transferase N-terminal domain-containing protein [Bosea sp. PAMC 26642]AMJ61961.1 glutathione S-transferase [Bosea sp. PAMC 26642]